MSKGLNRPYRLAVLNSHPIQYFAPLYRRLAQEPDIDLTVFYCSRQGSQQYIDPGFGQVVQWDVPLLEGYRYRFLPNLRRSEQMAGFFSLINPRVVLELYRGRYDALWVHGHNYLTFIIAIIAARILRIPVFMRCETHLQLSRSKVKQVLRRPLLSLFYRHLLAACLVIGSRNREFYRAHGVPERKLFDAPYTVDNAFFARSAHSYRAQADSIKGELHLPPDKPLILYASKLTLRKHPMDLLRAYERVRQGGTPVALLIVGSGEQETELTRYRAAHDIPDVFFFGFRNQLELPKFYAISDLFVLPSEDEPWGLIINEAMAAGLPIVASSEIGAVSDLVRDGVNGFLFPSGDVERLARAIRTLAEDAELRRHMRQRSEDTMSSWDFERDVRGICAALAATRRCTGRPAPVC
jgi:glycosyltransferase involved in cell wall biosynthesis